MGEVAALFSQVANDPWVRGVTATIAAFLGLQYLLPVFNVIVEPNEVGIRMRFGRPVKSRKTGEYIILPPGSYHIMYMIRQIRKVRVDQQTLNLERQEVQDINGRMFFNDQTVRWRRIVTGVSLILSEFVAGDLAAQIQRFVHKETARIVAQIDTTDNEQVLMITPRVHSAVARMIIAECGSFAEELTLTNFGPTPSQQDREGKQAIANAIIASGSTAAIATTTGASM